MGRNVHYPVRHGVRAARRGGGRPPTRGTRTPLAPRRVVRPQRPRPRRQTLGHRPWRASRPPWCGLGLLAFVRRSGGRPRRRSAARARGTRRPPARRAVRRWTRRWRCGSRADRRPLGAVRSGASRAVTAESGGHSGRGTGSAQGRASGRAPGRTGARVRAEVRFRAGLRFRAGRPGHRAPGCAGIGFRAGRRRRIGRPGWCGAAGRARGSGTHRHAGSGARRPSDDPGRRRGLHPAGSRKRAVRATRRTGRRRCRPRPTRRNGPRRSARHLGRRRRRGPPRAAGPATDCGSRRATRASPHHGLRRRCRGRPPRTTGPAAHGSSRRCRPRRATWVPGQDGPGRASRVPRGRGLPRFPRHLLRGRARAAGQGDPRGPARCPARDLG